ncbi:MAG TPA: DNA polymerase IV [Nitrospiria bacterium]|nr:DNA polymerase IV [Nitrospiria bacterium]
MTDRTLLHVDMDAFFASVEQRVHPALRGKPIAVCGANARTVVLTASYEARAYGVKTGMTLPEARALCPALIVVPSDHERYTDVSRRLLTIFLHYTPLVEVFSVDEAFLDITGSLILFGGAEAIASAVKRRIRREMQLTASVGIAPNKTLAKLGSGLKKPDGLVRIDPKDVPILLEDLPVKALCGIGPNLDRALADMEIRTCGQLGRAPVERLIGRFGIIGYSLKAMGLGQDDRPVVPSGEEPEAKSIGHSMTLPRDLRRAGEIERPLIELAEMVGRRARRNRYRGNVVTLTLRYADFQTFSRRRRLKSFLNDGLEIFLAARRILGTVRLEQAVRLVGVGLSGLIPDTGQLPLFETERRRNRLLATMDGINDRYGERTVRWGTLIAGHPHKAVISPAWRPKGVREYH